MKAFIFIPFLFFYSFCKSQNDKTLKQTKDTIILNHQKVVRIFIDKKVQSIVSLLGDTILTGDYYSDVKFIDINADGYKDIRAFVFSSTPNQCENYLFDKEKKIFKLIENCDLDIQLIKGTQYYYSYNSAGCADMNWESFLSKIENYKLISVGYIHGQGCHLEVKANQQAIEIYKITNKDINQKVFVKSLPYLMYIPKFDDKWSFIKNYWTKNCDSFIN